MTTQPVVGVIPVLTRGQRFTVAMEYADLTSEGMALALKKSSRTIRNYLVGKGIDWPTTQEWARVTGVDSEWLWSGAGWPNGGGVTPPLVRGRSRFAQHASGVAA